MLPKPIHQILIALFAAALGGGAVAVQANAASAIKKVLIVSETIDSVVLEVHYSYDGRQGNQVFASAQMTENGKALNYYAYRPGKVSRGKGRTQVTLGANNSAPALFTSDGVQLKLYQRGGSAFLTAKYSFVKTWAKSRAVLRPESTRVVARASPAAGRRVVTPMRSRLDLLAKARRSGVLSPGGLATPSGTTVKYSNAQPGTPPGSAPDVQHALWAKGEADRLLSIIATLLGNDSGALNWYKSTEEDTGSPYALISRRSEAIAVMVADEE